jgi:hypothetical protein
MIEIQDAARIALENLPRLIGAAELPGLVLDEIERSDDGQAWLATVSFLISGEGSPIERITGGKEHRVTKVLQIDAESGRVLGMRRPDVQ